MILKKIFTQSKILFSVFFILSLPLNLPVIAETKTNNNSIKIGSTVDGKFVSSFEPEPVVGLRYTFYSSSRGANYNLPPKDETTEVSKIANGYATLILSGSFKEESEKFVKLSDIRSSGVLYVKFRYDGLFDVKVPFKDFKKATRVSVSNKTSDLTLWLVKGIGVVKLVEKDKVSKAVITNELKDFRNCRNTKIDNRYYKFCLVFSKNYL